MIKLIRNFKQDKDKEQELRFTETNNVDLFFDTEKEIYEIDQWSLRSIKKLMNSTMSDDVILYYKKWNDKINELTKNPKIELTDHIFEENDFNSILKREDIFSIKKIIEEMSVEDVNNSLISMTKIYNDNKTLRKINYAINAKGVAAIKILNLLVLKYKIGDEIE